MSDKGTKALRKEVKEAVKELLPAELSKQHQDLVMVEVEKRLIKLEEKVRETLKKLEDDHKTTMSYLLRTLTTGELKIK